jgi:hypothetical protein
MAQLGHADPKVTLGIYAHVLERKGDTGDSLDALVRGADWALAGTSGLNGAPSDELESGTKQEKTPR